ncbi:MAG: helix-turn-helix transcriptional regulator [Clostridia bacterium]|nr:helix-turn-helix transcriptional regulator [Clostridia bacterium]
MSDLSELKDYIDMLKKEHNLSVSFSIDEGNISSEKAKALITLLRNSLGLNIAGGKENESGDLIDRVKNYININRNSTITSEHICKHIGCSRSLISHQFKDKTGMSLREYITSLRLEDAKVLLANSDLSVTEVAFAVGFSSSNYFANVFKRDIGMSPGEYRKKNK